MQRLSRADSVMQRVSQAYQEAESC
jgi:hypothetical protein